MKAKKKQNRSGLFCTKLSESQTQLVVDLERETGLHPAHILRGLVALGIAQISGCAPKDCTHRVAVAGALNKKAA